MKKVLFAAAAFALSATGVQAQMQPTQPDTATQPTPMPEPTATATPVPVDPATPPAEASMPGSTNDAVTTGSGETMSKDARKKHKKEKPPKA